MQVSVESRNAELLAFAATVGPRPLLRFYELTVAPFPAIDQPIDPAQVVMTFALPDIWLSMPVDGVARILPGAMIDRQQMRRFNLVRLLDETGLQSHRQWIVGRPWYALFTFELYEVCVNGPDDSAYLAATNWPTLTAPPPFEGPSGTGEVVDPSSLEPVWHYVGRAGLLVNALGTGDASNVPAPQIDIIQPGA